MVAFSVFQFMHPFHRVFDIGIRSYVSMLIASLIKFSNSCFCKHFTMFIFPRIFPLATVQFPMNGFFWSNFNTHHRLICHCIHWKWQLPFGGCVYARHALKMCPTAGRRGREGNEMKNKIFHLFAQNQYLDLWFYFGSSQPKCYSSNYFSNVFKCSNKSCLVGPSFKCIDVRNREKKTHKQINRIKRLNELNRRKMALTILQHK